MASRSQENDLLARYRNKGILLDTNVLLLLIVGAVSPTRIGRHKCTRRYSRGDFDKLVSFVGAFARVVTTPHVLTEASDLLNDAEEQAVLKSLHIVPALEICMPSVEVAERGEYLFLGLADTAVLAAGVGGGYLVVTDDGHLIDAIYRASGDALPFEAIRGS